MLSVNLPPLRSRNRDVIIASMQILAQLSEEMGTEPKVLGQNLIDTILDYEWPGNFREIRKFFDPSFFDD